MVKKRRRRKLSKIESYLFLCGTIFDEHDDWIVFLADE